MRAMPSTHPKNLSYTSTSSEAIRVSILVVSSTLSGNCGRLRWPQGRGRSLADGQPASQEHGSTPRRLLLMMMRMIMVKTAIAVMIILFFDVAGKSRWPPTATPVPAKQEANTSHPPSSQWSRPSVTGSPPKSSPHKVIQPHSLRRPLHSVRMRFMKSSTARLASPCAHASSLSGMNSESADSLQSRRAASGPCSRSFSTAPCSFSHSMHSTTCAASPSSCCSCPGN
mmetsp:Transcript_6554/g.16963  ORF Transcript_6554/g.16963 Transcript_6554/m.16963 type:complete len:227 (+) Transcript_6554:412-1092(+)